MKYNTIEQKKTKKKLGVKLHPNQSSFVLKWHIKLKSHQLIQRLKIERKNDNSQITENTRTRKLLERIEKFPTQMHYNNVELLV